MIFHIDPIYDSVSTQVSRSTPGYTKELFIIEISFDFLKYGVSSCMSQDICIQIGH